MPDSQGTREKLLDAAARLFAERGVDNVSIAEIVRASGQRNTSAVHYHFGSRNEILLAVLARTVPDLAARRHQLLQSATDGHSVAEAIVRPVTELAQRGWREQAYLQIGFELTGALDRSTEEIRELMDHTEGPAAWDLLRSHCPAVPADVWEERKTICINFVGQAAARRTRRPSALTDEAFVENLISMVLAAMTA